MKETKWYYPKSIKEAYNILQSEKGILHAGGTWLKPAVLSKFTAIIDLYNTRLNYFNIDKKLIRMGAMLSFNETKEHLSRHFQSHILIDAMKQSAAEPLRNRITLGGSIAAFPVWSDLVGPLLTLNAKVSLFGKEEKEIDLETYLNSQNLKTGYLIKEIIIPAASLYSFFYKEVKTRFDYASFTISLIDQTTKEHVNLPSFVLTGVKSKYMILKEVQRAFQIDKKDNEIIKNSITNLELDFTNKNGRSSKYLASIAKVKLLEGINKLKNSIKE